MTCEMYTVSHASPSPSPHFQAAGRAGSALPLAARVRALRCHRRSGMSAGDRRGRVSGMTRWR